MARLYNGGGAGTDKITLANYTAIDNLVTLTLSVWIYQIGGGPGGFGIITDKATGWGWGAPVNGPRFFANRWASQGEWEFAVLTTMNVWRHLVITYDYGSTSNVPLFYINGASTTRNIITTPSGILNSASNDTIIGNRSAGDLALDGYLAEFAIWSRVLTPTEVTLVYQCTPHALPNGRVAYLPLGGWERPETNVDHANQGVVAGTKRVAHPTLPQCHGYGLGPQALQWT